MTNQVAITMLKNLEQSLDDYCELNDEGKEVFSMAITALELFGNSEQLPSTHSKLEKNSQKLDNENGELISRQEVIAEFSCCELTPDGGIDANYAIDFLEQLPSVQPEIIRCKDCKYSDMTSNGLVKYCDIWFPDDQLYQDGDYYCADAELRGEEV